MNTKVRLTDYLPVQVIGMLPGKDGQSPYVTCGAKVRPSLARSLVCSPVRPSICLSLHSPASPCPWLCSPVCPLVCLMPHLSLRYRSDKDFLGKDSRKLRVGGWRAVTLIENTAEDFKENVKSGTSVPQQTNTLPLFAEGGQRKDGTSEVFSS